MEEKEENVLKDKKKEITDGETIITLFFIAILIVIFIGQPISEHFKVVKECKQAIRYVPAKGAVGGTWGSPAEDAYFTYYRTPKSGFDVQPKFESRDIAIKDCVFYKKSSTK